MAWDAEKFAARIAQWTDEQRAAMQRLMANEDRDFTHWVALNPLGLAAEENKKLSDYLDSRECPEIWKKRIPALKGEEMVALVLAPRDRALQASLKAEFTAKTRLIIEALQNNFDLKTLNRSRYFNQPKNQPKS